MRYDIFGKKRYKVNLHMHTSLSDGAATPEEAAQRYLSEGYEVYNLLNYYTYYILGMQMKHGVTPSQLLNEWNAYTFDSPDKKIRLDPTSHTVRGGAFCLWCDKPSAESCDDILKNLAPFLLSAGKAML